MTGNPANSFFYLLTGLHGLHILGGLVALARAAPAAWSGAGSAKLRLRLELCVAYWHFLLFVWLCLLVLFTGWAADFVNICRRSPDLRYPSMAEISPASLPVRPRPPGWRGIVADWSSDQRAFKQVSWKKAMMWIFLLSDTFIFSCFLIGYMTARMLDDGALAEPERGLRAARLRPELPAPPDRDHDLRADLVVRHHGAGGQLRLPPRPA